MSVDHKKTKTLVDFRTEYYKIKLALSNIFN